MSSLQLRLSPLNTAFTSSKSLHSPPKYARIQCSAAPTKQYSITLLPGDGIRPEVISVAKQILTLSSARQGIEFRFQELPIGRAALDLSGVRLPDETHSIAKQSDAVLLGAIRGYKWNKNAKHLKPETGLLQIREGLGVFANLRPATVLPQLQFNLNMARVEAKPMGAEANLRHK